MSKELHVIVGLGVTSLSVARFLAQQNIPIALVDTRDNPPALPQFKKEYPEVETYLGGLNEAILDQAASLVVSPGVSIKEPAIVKQIKKGKKVIGDIELFAETIKAPVIAITGTNAKSTVTTLVGKMAQASGLRTEVGGNIGTPVLDLLRTPNPQVYVLELSSFQLETTFSLAPRIATILNISPDHMDRYATEQEYRLAKHRIYSQCETAVFNRDDPATYPQTEMSNKIRFTLQIPAENEFGVLAQNGDVFLAYEDKILLPVRDLPILGRHYHANALAALAIGKGFGLSIPAMLQTLAEFKGLAHRCQLVRERNGVSWYNDSKGTNVGATLAAIAGLGPEIKGKLILIAGGLGKNADFSSLAEPVKKYVKTVVLIGEDAPLLGKILKDSAAINYAGSMEEAVAAADNIAVAGDSVLLSPACASFDMFKNFEHRGEVFTGTVQALK